MSEIAVIGEQPVVAGFALAGARVYPADGSAQVHAVWEALPSSVEVVLLTVAAAEALDDLLLLPQAPLSVVMPQ
ncbi:MAG: V-type ATP synthase subunit F [Nocardioides sp.]